MFSLSYLVTKLYPEKSVDEQQKLAEQCLSIRVEEYFPQTWEHVRYEQLTEEGVQLNLIRTVYESQFGDSEAIDPIMTSFETWTDGTMAFTELSVRDASFLQDIYLTLGFLNFDKLAEIRQLYLLGTRMMVRALLLEIPVYAMVETFFASISGIKLSEETAMLMANALGRNEAPVGEKGKDIMTVGEWITDFTEFTGNSIEGKVDEYLSGMKIKRYAEDIQAMIASILTLYYGLRTGFIWRDITEYAVPAGFARKEKQEGKKAKDYYLQALYNLSEDDFAVWLKDYRATSAWLNTTRKTGSFIQKLLFVVRTKAKLSDPEQVDQIFQFFYLLKEMGAQNIDDVLTYNEEKGTFVWDDSFFLAFDDESLDEEPEEKTVVNPTESLDPPLPFEKT